MSSISHWLVDLGLGEYAPVFAANGIDLRVLPELTERDLEEIGVLLGHRRLILKAARIESRFDGSCVEHPCAAVEEGERRQISVFFCDLVESTTLATRMDPEDMSVLITRYHTSVAEVVTIHGGVIDQFLGDGVMAFFGFPSSHEDDTEQAIFAGLAAVEAVSKITFADDLRLACRVGIATGIVVGKRPQRDRSASGRRFVGETLNLAARLQALAEPGTVVVCPNSRYIAGDMFIYQELGPISIKGWERPIPVSAVVRRSDVESRFDARHHCALAPLIGRDEELELLGRRWRDAVRGQGRVIILSGEAGIGKSHLLRALEDLIAWEPHRRLSFYCSSHHQNTVLFPFIARLERAAKIGRHDPVALKVEKLEKLVERVPTLPASIVPVICGVMSLSHPDTDDLHALSPQERKRRAIAAFVEIFCSLSLNEPILMVFEDAHWADPTSLELLAALVEEVPRHQILLVASTRTSDTSTTFNPSWATQAHVRSMLLNYLDKQASVELMTRVAAGKRLPRQVVQEVLRYAEGLPLFVEEYTKTVIESEQLFEHPDRYELKEGVVSLTIPKSLRASLAERLDRLNDAREVAQIGAVIGREFSRELLLEIPGQSRFAVDNALAELVGSGLVVMRGDDEQAIYRFKHALLRDEAYECLLKNQRLALHSAIATAIEEKFPESVATEPETLAYHYSNAGLPARAIDYWLAAARMAIRRSAYAEALAHLKNGLEDAHTLPVGRSRSRVELDLTFELAPCLIATQGPAATESVEAFGEARRLCEELGDAPEYLQVMFWFATAGVIRGELDQAYEATAAMGRVAIERYDLPATMNALRGQAMIRMFQGRLDDAHSGFLQALEKFESADEPQRLAARVAGQDPGAAGHAQLAWIHWLKGAPDQAKREMSLAIARAEEVRHPHTAAYVCYYSGVLDALRGEFDAAMNSAQNCLRLSEAHEFRQWLGLAGTLQSVCQSMLSIKSCSQPDLESALDSYLVEGYRLGITVLYALRGDALLREGKVAEALGAIELGFESVARNNERIVEAELCRLHALAIKAQAGSHAASTVIQLLEDSISCARKLNSAMFELRATTDLVEFTLAQTEPTATAETVRRLQQRLSAAIDKIRGMQASLDLDRARALQAQILAGSR